MAENEVNVISHLLEVESQASALIDDAQIESNKKILAAKAKADEIFYSKYRETVEVLEKQYNDKIKSYETEHNNEIESYKNKIVKSEKDVNAFNSFLNSTLSKA